MTGQCEWHMGRKHRWTQLQKFGGVLFYFKAFHHENLDWSGSSSWFFLILQVGLCDTLSGELHKPVSIVALQRSFPGRAQFFKVKQSMRNILL